MYVGEIAETRRSPKWSGKQFALYQVDQKLVLKNKQTKQKPSVTITQNCG